jgi:integrase
VNYRNYLDAYVTPIIGESAIQDLAPVRLNLLYGYLLEEGRVRGPGGLAPKTVQKVHRMLHRALRDAVKWDVVPRNAAEDASPPRSTRPRPQIWTPEQLGLFVGHVQRDRFYSLWLLVATTGLRRGELAGLRRTDIDWDHARVNPSTPRVVVDGHAQDSEAKTRSGERWVALDPRTLAALKEYVTTWSRERDLLGQDTQLLFVWPGGRTLHPDTITDLFRKHCVAAVSVHPTSRCPTLLRHGCAEGWRLTQDHQRAPRSLVRGLHSSDIHAGHPRHGRAGGLDRRRPHPSPGSTSTATKTATKMRRRLPRKTKNPLTRRISAGQRVLHLVAGAEFEPATSGL